MAIQDGRKVEAIDLLHKYLELRSRTPDLNEWTEERLVDNPPRLLRLQQLRALFQAFGIVWDPVAFTTGQFIQPDYPRYAVVLTRAATEMPIIVAGELSQERYHLPILFAILLRYRETLDRGLNFAGGVAEASGLAYYAYAKVEQLNREIRGKLAIVEDVLAALISPEGRSFSIDELARDYGYPDVDVRGVDAEWY